MTPKGLLADLIGRGFRLAVRGNSIEIAPRSKLTDRIRQDIRRNKVRLITLLRAGQPLNGQAPAPGKNRQKAPRRKAAKASVRLESPRVSARAADDVGDKTTHIQDIGHSSTQGPIRTVPGPEAITAPANPPEPIRPAKRLTPLLCQCCRQLGYAHCRECLLATDSSLALEGRHIVQVRLPTERDLWPWHRCRRCDNSFKAPQFPAQRLCPDCVAKSEC